MRSLAAVAVLFAVVMPPSASAAECGGMAIHRKSGKYYWAGGNCSNYGANAAAFDQCSRSESEPSQCTGAHTDAEGYGYRELSKCGDEFMALACKPKALSNPPKHLCRLGCAWSEESAKTAALRDCNSMFGAGREVCVWVRTIGVRSL